MTQMMVAVVQEKQGLSAGNEWVIDMKIVHWWGDVASEVGECGCFGKCII
jgi:quercetin dioxygenase-like cupin family protein